MKETTDNNQKCFFFRFPVDRTTQWLQAIFILNNQKIDIKTSSFVCSKHFEIKQIISNFGSIKLCDQAVPTIFNSTKLCES